MDICTRPKKCNCVECQEDQQIQEEINYLLGERY